MDKVIYAKLSIIESDSTRELIKIITLIMLYSLWGSINSYSLSISNT